MFRAAIVYMTVTKFIDAVGLIVSGIVEMINECDGRPPQPVSLLDRFEQTMFVTTKGGSRRRVVLLKFHVSNSVEFPFQMV